MPPDVASLQLLFAELNNAHFGGEIPPYRIAYNARFRNVAGRVRHRPRLIELSVRHFEGRPEALRETLLHEMIHAWLHARGLPSGHTPAFKRKMRELGLRSIYHDLGRLPPKNGGKRYLLRCEGCAMEVERTRRPARSLSCARCNPHGFDPRFRIRVFEVALVTEKALTA